MTEHPAVNERNKMTPHGRYRVTVDIDVTAASFGKAQNYVQSVIGRGWNAIKVEEAKESDKALVLEQYPNVDYFETTNIQRLDVGTRAKAIPS